MLTLRYRELLPPGPVADEFESMVSQLRALLSVSFDEDGNLVAASPTGTIEVGTVFEYAGSVLPDRYLWCDGSQVSRVTYKTLYERIGTAHGAGDGSTTFNLPDHRGRFALGKAATGTGSVLGETGGELDHTHDGGSHTHTWSQSLSTGSNGGFSTSTDSGGGHSHTASGTTSDLTEDSYAVAFGSDAEVSGRPHTHPFSTTTSSDGSHAHGITVSNHTHTVDVGGTTSAPSAGDTGAANPAYSVVNKMIYTGVL